MKVAKDLVIQTVTAECPCGGSLTQGGSLMISVHEQSPILCQNCETEYKLPVWIAKHNQPKSI